MVTILLEIAGLVAASAVLGQAVAVVCGFRGWRPWAPAVGFALLIVIGAQVGRVPGRTTTLAILILVLLVAALLLRGVRSALRQAAPEGLPLGLGVLLASALPFFATGRAGVLGVNVSNDMSAHLVAAWWLRTRDGYKPVGALNDNLITDGYPLGPHGLVAVVTDAIGSTEAYVFPALTCAVPVLVALAALTVLPERPRAGRLAVAALVGLAYLAAAYLTQGSFKETIVELTLVGAAAVLADLVREGGARALRRGAPLGLLAAAGLYTYSHPGALWALGAALGLLVAEAVRLLVVSGQRRWRRLLRFLRAAALAGLGAVVTFAVTAGPDIGRVTRFADSKFTELPKGRTANLFHPLPPLESVGVWLVGDFRLRPDPIWLSYGLSWIALAALVAGLPWWWRRATLAPPLALVSGVVLWGELALNRNAYAAAKGLAIMAPLIVLCVGGPLLAAWRARARSRGGTALLRLARVVGAVLLAAAAASSFAVLRDASVGLGPQQGWFDEVRRITHGQLVLFLGIDHFIQWELRGTELRTAGTFYSPHAFPTRLEKPIPPGGLIDVDNFTERELDRVDWIVIHNGYKSAMPPNYRLARRIGPLELYRRRGPTAPRVPIEPPGQAGAVLDCNTPIGQRALRDFRAAAVLPAPVFYDQRVWVGKPSLPGRSGTARVPLPPGRWDVSLQYVTPTGLRLTGPGLRADLPPWFGRINSFWSAGTITHRGGAVELTATALPQRAFGRLIRASRRTRAITSPGAHPLNGLAFTRHGARPRLVPVSRACGRWVDYYLPSPPA